MGGGRLRGGGVLATLRRENRLLTADPRGEAPAAVGPETDAERAGDLTADGATAGEATVFVCVACRREGGAGGDAGDQPGIGFLAAVRERLDAAAGGAGIGVEPVDCLAVCKRPCTVALAGAGKWTYIVGDLDEAAHADDVAAAALSYARTTNGIIPWRERPKSFRSGVVARVPPLPKQMDRIK